MKVLVTGGTGSVGRCAVARLVENGHEVRVIGRTPDLEIEGGEYARCDVNDYAGLREQVKGCEGIVHLAAIPYPGGGTPEEISRVNNTGTFNVYQAAAEEGIKRVVSASSINALGYNFRTQPFTLSYFPIDEEHPCIATDAYSFSKQVMEQTAAYYWRREGISGICLRLPGVYEVDAERSRRWEGFREKALKSYEELFALEEEKRAARVQDIRTRIDAMHANRQAEKRGSWREIDEDLRSFMFGINNFWTLIDARDSAQALEQGLVEEYEGSHPLFVNDHHNVVGIESEQLVSTFFPEVKGRSKKLEGTECLVSIDRARQLLGFAPEFSLGGEA